MPRKENPKFEASLSNLVKHCLKIKNGTVCVAQSKGLGFSPQYHVHTREKQRERQIDREVSVREGTMTSSQYY